MKRRWKKKDVCYLNFVPGCDSNFDKCTVTMDQSNSDQLHTHRYVHTDTHTYTHQCKHTLYTNTYADMYTYTLLLCISLRLACPGSLSSSLTNELEAAPPLSPKSSFLPRAQSLVGQQGQTTFKDNSVPSPLSVIPPLCHSLFVCISMENEQECEPVQVQTAPPPPDLFVHPSVCPPPPSPSCTPNRQTDILALLQF